PGAGPRPRGRARLRLAARPLPGGGAALHGSRGRHPRGRRRGAGAVIRGVDHLGIAVRSIAESRVFYEALGLAVEAIEEVPDEEVRVALIPCGAMRLELLEPTSRESPIARFIERRGPGLHHLCLSTDDLGADDA